MSSPLPSTPSSWPAPAPTATLAPAAPAAAAAAAAAEAPSPPNLPGGPPAPPSPALAGLAGLFGNPVFAGGIGLAGLGYAAALGRRALLQAAALARRQLLVSVEISKRDPSYPWVLAWLSAPRAAPPGFLAARLTRIRALAVSTSVRALGSGPAAAAAAGARGGEDGPTRAHFRVQPGFGHHLVRHRPGVYVAVRREKLGTASTQTGEPHETLTLTLLWAHRGVLEDIFREAHGLVAQAREGRTAVYTVRGMAWEPLGTPPRKRPLGSVMLDRGVKEAVVDDVREFMASQQWYVDRGVPYRRGYLLHGPPGTGKTSFIQALAGELDYNIAMINLAARGVTDDLLAQLLATMPERSILVLEDVDAALANRRRRSEDGHSGPTVTYSGLLNALDGMAAASDRIAFLTTNHIDRLDPALIRPGRVDMIMRIGEATRYQASEMWKRYYGDRDADGSAHDRFLQRLDELGLFGEARGDAPARRTSTAAIQGLFQCNKGDFEGAIRMAEGLIPRTFEADEPASEGCVKTRA